MLLEPGGLHVLVGPGGDAGGSRHLGLDGAVRQSS